MTLFCNEIVLSQNPQIFDLDLIESYRHRALKHKDSGVDFLLKRMAVDLEERLQPVERIFENALDLHGFNGVVADSMGRSQKVKNITRIETNKHFVDDTYSALIRSREFLDLPAESADLIVSLLSLHLTNDTPGVFIQIRQALRPDGLFLACLAGAGTLGELRESLLQAENEIYGGVSPRIYPFIDVRDAGALLQRAGFAMPVSDIESVTVRYDNAFDLMRDLRQMGMQNALFDRSRRPVSKRFFMRVAEIYASRFADSDGRIRATFNFVWLSGWAPHPDQQKPSKRGSAKVSLADVLMPPKSN